MIETISRECGKEATVKYYIPGRHVGYCCDEHFPIVEENMARIGVTKLVHHPYPGEGHLCRVLVRAYPDGQRIKEGAKNNDANN